MPHVLPLNYVIITDFFGHFEKLELSNLTTLC